MINQTVKRAKSFIWLRKQDFSFENVLWTVFQVDSFLLVMVFVSSGSPFPSFDLTFVDQLGDAIHSFHIFGSIYNQNIKGFNPNYLFHHHDITLKIVIGLTTKGKYRKVMTIKIRLWNLDKCSRLIKSCLHV